MLGVALTELLPKSALKDIMSYANADDENEPIIKTVPAGEGKPQIQKAALDNKQVFKNMRF